MAETTEEQYQTFEVLFEIISGLPNEEQKKYIHAIEVVSRYGGILELGSQLWGIAIPDHFLPDGIAEIKAALKLLASLIGPNAGEVAPKLGTGYYLLSNFVAEPDAVLVRNLAKQEIDYCHPDADRALEVMQEQGVEGRRLLDEWKLFLSTL